MNYPEMFMVRYYRKKIKMFVQICSDLHSCKYAQLPPSKYVAMALYQ